MTNKNQGRSGNKSKNARSQGSTAKRENVQNEPETKPKANDCQYVKQEPPNVYVTIPPTEKEKWSLANKIALGMGIITLALTIFTYLLFVKAGVQADQAVRAANSADSVLVETKKEFNIINQPLVQMLSDSTKPKTMEIGKQFVMEYLLVNLKDITAKVIATETYFWFDSIPPNLDSFKTALIYRLNTKPPNVNQFITKEKPVSASATSEAKLTSEDVMYLLGENHKMFLLTAIKCENLITKEPVYSFITLQFTFRPNGTGTTQIIRNDLD